MSVPGNNVIAFLSLFAASLAGSVHCVGMCGGLMLSATGTRLSAQLTYHLFRLFGYLFVGGIAGYLGQELLLDWAWLPIQIFFSSVFMILLLAFAFSIALDWPFFNRLKQLRWMSAFSQMGIRMGYRIGSSDGSLSRAACIGFFTVFLPCGWLYSFVLLSIASHDAGYALLTLFVFWLGTLPALFSSRILIQGMLSKIGLTGTRAISMLMILASLVSVYEHLKTIPSHGTATDPTSIHCR